MRFYIADTLFNGIDNLYGCFFGKFDTFAISDSPGIQQSIHS